MPVVSISDSQRTPLPWVNWQGTVYHGLPLDLCQFHPGPGKYLAFLGRISPEKGVDSAIAIAQQTGIELRIAAKVDVADQSYFESVIEPLLDSPLVKFVGEIADSDKSEFLGNAMALLAPVNWPEPFGLALIESMACGTPVIAFRCGSIPEVVDELKSGFIVDNVDEAVAAIKTTYRLDRRLCRRTFEQRFSALRMAQDYFGIYEKLVENKTDVNAMARRRAASQES